ncbi:MAG: tetratricopeptide repeat protein [Byssovorax sp.]
MTANEQAPVSPPGDALPDQETQLETQLAQLRANDRHELAAALGERLVELREARLGVAHPRTLVAVVALSESYYQMARYDHAEALCERAVHALDDLEPPEPVAFGHALAQLAKVSRELGLHGRAEALYQSAIAAHKEAPEPDVVGLARSYHGLSAIFDDRGQLDKAEAMCRAALTIREKVFGEDALPVAESINSLAILHLRKSDFAEAERLHLRALAIYELRQGSDHPGAAHTLVNLGILYSEKGEHPKAEALFARASALIDARGGPPDALTATLLDALATHYALTGEGSRAIDAARRTLALRKELFGPSNPEVATALNNLGAKLVGREETRDEAEALFRRALTLVDATPRAASFGPMMLNLAAICLAKDDLEEAKALATRALTLARAGDASNRADAAAALVSLSQIAEQRKDVDRALELMLEAFTLRAERSLIDQSISDLTRLGTLFLATDQPEQASKFLKEALSRATGSRGKDHPSLAHLTFLAGKAALAQKQWKQALFSFDRSLAIDEKAKGRSHEDLVETLRLSAEANLELGKLGAAEAVYRRMGDIYAKIHPLDSEWQGIVPALLGDVAMKRKAFEKASDLFEEALTIAEAAFGQDSIRLHAILDKAAEAHLKNGQLVRAEELSRRLLGILERVVAPDHPILLASVRRLATVYVETGDARAEEMVKRVVASLEAATEEAKEEARKKKADLARRRGQS